VGEPVENENPGVVGDREPVKASRAVGSAARSSDEMPGVPRRPECGAQLSFDQPEDESAMGKRSVSP